MGVEQNPRASEALNRGASGPARMPRLIAPDNSSAVPIVVSCPLSRLRGGPTLLGPDTTPRTDFMPRAFFALLKDFAWLMLWRSPRSLASRAFNSSSPGKTAPLAHACLKNAMATDRRSLSELGGSSISMLTERLRGHRLLRSPFF